MFLPCSDRGTYNWLTTASKFSPCCAEAVRGGFCLAFCREQSEKCCRFHSGWINHKLWFHRLHSTLTWSLYPSATASERRQDQFTKCRRWEWPIGISGGGGQSSAIGCLLWPVSMPVCLRGGSRMLTRQRRSGAEDMGVTSPALDGHSVLRGGSWRRAHACVGRAWWCGRRGVGHFSFLLF